MDRQRFDRLLIPAFVSFLCFITFVSLSSIPTEVIAPGTYKIENMGDGLHLTIQGVNASFATVVGDTWRDFREQRWTFKKMPFTLGYQLQPSVYGSNNLLSFHKDALKKYAQPETWMFKEVKTTGKTYYQMVNERTTYCLTSAGRRREVTELKCDIYRRNQQWKLTKA